MLILFTVRERSRCRWMRFKVSLSEEGREERSELTLSLVASRSRNRHRLLLRLPLRWSPDLVSSLGRRALSRGLNTSPLCSSSFGRDGLSLAGFSTGMFLFDTTVHTVSPYMIVHHTRAATDPFTPLRSRRLVASCPVWSRAAPTLPLFSILTTFHSVLQGELGGDVHLDSSERRAGTDCSRSGLAEGPQRYPSTTALRA